MRGRVGSVAGFITAGLMPRGSAASGALLTFVGPRVSVLVLTAGMLALAAAASLSETIRTAPESPAASHPTPSQ
jgi:hypothetical protein